MGSTGRFADFQAGFGEVLMTAKKHKAKEEMEGGSPSMEAGEEKG